MKNQKFETKLAEVEDLTKTPTDGGLRAETTLEDWMKAGNWETMPAQDIADEWDALSDDSE